MPKNLTVENFAGAVSVKNSIVMEDGRSYWTFAGVVSLLEAKTAVGFGIENRDANWFARVESPDGERSVNILGCQIQVIMQGGFGFRDASGTGIYRV